MRYVESKGLQAGMKLAKNVTNNNNAILLVEGTELTENHINNLKRFKIAGLYIDDEWSADIFVNSLIDDETANQSIKALQNFDIIQIQKCAEQIVNALANSFLLLDDAESIKEYDENTYEHSLRVAKNSILLGIGMDYDFFKLKNLAIGALLHDIGKKAIPLSILNKPGKLTPEEFELIKTHSEIGYNLLRDNDNISESVKQIIWQHHENFDGTGYPRKLNGSHIYEPAMVVHICDVWDALLSKRSYKEAFSFKESIEIIQKGVNTMYDPQILVHRFLNNCTI